MVNGVARAMRMGWILVLIAAMTTACASGHSNAGVAKASTSGTRGEPVSVSGALPSGLWVSDIHTNSVTLFPSPPQSSGTVTLTNGLNHPDALAFNGPHELWVGNGSTTHPSIAEYIVQPDGKPSLIHDFPLSGFPPEGLTFDRHGNLWLAGAGGVIELAGPSLASGPRAITTITAPALLDGPDAVAFDTRGDLWVANYNNRVLLEFPARSLTSHSPQPSFHIQLPSGANPFALTFDAQGDLWVAAQNDMVYEFAAGTLGTTSSPSRSISLGQVISGGVVGVAFDGHGNLWVSGVGSSAAGAPEGFVYEYAAQSLGTTNIPTARMVASPSSNPGTWAIAFTPSS